MTVFRVDNPDSLDTDSKPRFLGRKNFYAANSSATTRQSGHSEAVRLDGQLERRPTLRKDQKILIRDSCPDSNNVPIRQSIPTNSVNNSVNNSCASLDSVPGKKILFCEIFRFCYKFLGTEI